MKNIKLFESYFDDLYKDYNYIVFKEGKPDSSWFYFEDVIENGIIESIYGLSTWELSEDMQNLIEDIVLKYSDIDLQENEIIWEEFQLDIQNLVEKLNNEYNESHIINVSKS